MGAPSGEEINISPCRLCAKLLADRCEHRHAPPFPANESMRVAGRRSLFRRNNMSGDFHIGLGQKECASGSRNDHGDPRDDRLKARPFWLLS
jgi:hypothetical protein